MKRCLSFIVSILPILALSGKTPFDGLCGKDLFNAVREIYRNHKTVDDNDIWKQIAYIDASEKGGISNIFSNEELSYPAYGLSPDNGGIFQVIPFSYWTPVEPSLNLAAIFPAPVTIIEQRRDYPPMFDASRVSSLKQIGYISTGIFTIAPGYDINCYLPPKGYEGDFARIIMMMVLLYPCDSWQGKGNNICLDNDFPVFQPYYLNDLMAAVISDPVDERERLRNDKITKIQGYGNPFVEFPELASHIWGNDKDKPFQSEPSHDDRSPIKPLYTSADRFFYCYSPYLPGDVTRFEIDGRSYEGSNPVPLESMAAGRHIVKYKGSGFSGTVIIEVTK